ncbi:MAG: site-specific DNA-methyltransferase [Selenomonadaceae bacterium]|nr:site-specific DNA-methyltransferase [Selenomonadaceae bacterium]
MPTLDWENKSAALQAANNAPYHLLEFDSASSCGDDDNLIIQGDNLLVMKALLPYYRQKVKCIYIDPPYNSRAASIYNDNFEHSEWLSMMYPRLELLRDFLSDDGAIFISIDDEEQAYLKVICDEIFDRKNFVANIAVVNNLKGRSDAKYIATAHENLIIYRRENFNTNGVPIPEEYLKEYKLEDSGGKYRLQGLRKRGANSRREDRPNMFYPFFYDESNKVLSVEKIPNSIEILPHLSDGSDGCWRWGIDTAGERIDKLIVQKVKGRNEYDVFQKDYLPNNEVRRVKPKSFWLGTEFSSDAGTLEVKSILGKGSFNNPKPLGLLEYILQQATDKNSLVLDAFAGSGTTAHAVINLNASDGDNRKFIMIEEQDYCKTITAERVKKVGGSFKYYRLGAELFDETGAINRAVTFRQLAAYIWFKCTGTPYTLEGTSPLLGIDNGTAYYLVRDVLTKEILATLPAYEGDKIIFGEACRLSAEVLLANKITFQQIPTKIKA